MPHGLDRGEGRGNQPCVLIGLASSRACKLKKEPYGTVPKPDRHALRVLGSVCRPLLVSNLKKINMNRVEVFPQET